MRYVIFGVLLFMLVLAGCLQTQNSQEQGTQLIGIGEVVEEPYTKGDPNAPVVIVEFGDFQCPYCAKFYRETLPLIEKNYIETGKVMFVYKHFPIPGHENAEIAGEAAECAGEQGKFWEMHDMMFENSFNLGREALMSYAQRIGLNMEEFEACLNSGKYKKKIEEHKKEGQAYGVSGTPTFLINGRKVVGAYPYEYFEQIIEEELRKVS